MQPDLQVPQGGTNAFGDPIIRLTDLFKDPAVESCIRSGLYMKFNGIGLSEEIRNEVVEQSIHLAKISTDLLSFEKEAYALLQSRGVISLLPKKISGRAEQMAQMLLPHATPGSVLDLGCGPGGVGKIFADYEGYKVTLADVYKNPKVEDLNIPFVFVKQNADLPFSEETFDHVLILAMLHHTSDPLHTIRETRRILKKHGRLHLIETVYGIDQEALPKNSSKQDQIFAQLTFEQQRQATMFFDYFGNHVTWYYTEKEENHVPVPFNFNTPVNWERIFKESGFTIIEKRPLGSDPGSGVFHHLFLFERL